MNAIKTADGLDLYGHDWLVEDPVATVAIIHGYGEHGERYEHVAKAYNDKRISVLGVDLRGHGRSPGTRGYVDRFSDYHLDLTALYEKALEASKGTPVFVFAHSMGGLICLDWLSSGVRRELPGVIISSPYLGLALAVPEIKKKLGLLTSAFIPKLAMNTGLLGKHVTRDPEKARLYDSDPLNNKKATSRWFIETGLAIERVHAVAAAHIQFPMLLLYGGDDQVASADDTDRFAAQLKGENITTERLPGYAHELVNEPLEFRNVIIQRTADWVLSQI